MEFENWLFFAYLYFLLAAFCSPMNLSGTMEMISFIEDEIIEDLFNQIILEVSLIDM